MTKAWAGIVLALVLAISLAPCFGSMATPMIWSVSTETGASDLNGGGFDPAASGQRYNFSATNGGTCAPHVTVDNSTVTATVNGAVITFPAGYTVSPGNDPGNVINIISASGGTPPTLGRYTVASGSGNTLTLDRTTGAVTSTITAARLGGCLATNEGALAAMVAANAAGGHAPVLYTRAGTYIPTATLSMGQFGSYGRWYGYQTTPGDCPQSTGQPVIQPSGAFTAVTFSNSGAQWAISCITFDNANNAGTVMLIQNGDLVALNWVTVKNIGNHIGFFGNGDGTLSCVHCDISGSTDASHGAFWWTSNSRGLIIQQSGLHGNAVAVNTSGMLTFEGNDCWGNTACLAPGDLGGVAANNVIDGNAIGIDFLTADAIVGHTFRIVNNSITHSSLYGIRAPGPLYENAGWDCNGYGFNAANFNGSITAGAHDVAITAEPYINRAGTPPDFTLNAAAGGGAALKNAGCSVIVAGALGTGTASIGSLAPAPLAAGHHTEIR